MNLKEAFQAQNKIEDLFQTLAAYLSNEENITLTKEKHFRSKAAQGQLDEELDVTNYDRKTYETNKAIKFLLFLIEEREKISTAIHAAKATMNFDLDSAVDVNKKRHAAIEVFRNLRQLKSTGILKKNFGTGYVFNNEGNQTSYKYDVEVVKTIDFDRNKIRDIVKNLQEKADAISNEIDSALINTQVDYVLPFDAHANLIEILDDATDSKVNYVKSSAPDKFDLSFLEDDF